MSRQDHVNLHHLPVYAKRPAAPGGAIHEGPGRCGSGFPRRLDRDTLPINAGECIMPCRASIGAITIITVSMMASGAQTAETARYPDWKGAWERFVPAVSTASPSGLRTAGGQPSFDQIK